MEATKKKYKDLTALVGKINASIGKQETKVQKKLQKFFEKAIKPHLESYNSQLDEFRLDNAATDDKGVVLMEDKGGYKFTKDGIKKFQKDADSLADKEFDYNPIEVFNPNGLEDLHFLKDWTTGITFNEEIVNEEEEL